MQEGAERASSGIRWAPKQRDYARECEIQRIARGRAVLPACQAWKPSGAATPRDNFESENPAVLGGRIVLARGREVSAEDDEPRFGPELRRRPLHGPGGEIASIRERSLRQTVISPPDGTGARGWAITGAPDGPEFRRHLTGHLSVEEP
jgi:hypothetical protein